MKKIEKLALMDTVAIMSLSICAVVAFCLLADWLSYVFASVVLIGGLVAAGFLFITIFEWRLKVNSK